MINNSYENINKEETWKVQNVLCLEDSQLRKLVKLALRNLLKFN